MCLAYVVDPVIESGDSGEDGGFLLVVAAQARNEAGNAMNLPDTLSVLTVQRASRVTLDTEREEEGLCFINLVEPLLHWLGAIMRMNQNHCFTKCNGVTGSICNIPCQLKNQCEGNKIFCDSLDILSEHIHMLSSSNVFHWQN